jgi:amino acid transporter
LFEAELSADSYQIMGMAERGHIPPIFKERSRHGTPTYGIMLGLLVIIILAGVSNLDQLIELLNFNYALAVLMEYCAFIRLRFVRDDIPRPWKLPLNKYGCLVYFFPTIAITVLTLSLATYTTLLFSLCVNVVGVILYKARILWRRDTTTYAPVVAVTDGNIETTAATNGHSHTHVT